MEVISFDVGIKNLAYCILRRENRQDTIKHLEKIDLKCKKNETQKIADCLIEVLDDILYNKLDLNLSIVVLIESQMISSMKAIQTVINTFFKVVAKYQSLDIKTRYMSAKLKLSLVQQYKSYNGHSTIASSQYKQNKIDSVHFASWLLKESFPEYVRDSISPDESDCLLMCVHYTRTI